MARSFDGVDDRLEVNQTPVTAAPFTVSAWVKSGSATANQTAVFVGDKDLSDEFWRLDLDGGSAGEPVRWQADDGEEASSQATTSTGFSAGTWHHVCGVEASATDRRVFIDGGSKGTNTTNRTPDFADRVTVGRSGDSSPSREFDGEIGHVAIWNVALTDDEVASLAAGISPLQIRRDALVAYWPLNGLSPEPDVVGSRNLVVTGATKAEEPPIPNSIVAA